MDLLNGDQRTKEGNEKGMKRGKRGEKREKREMTGIRMRIRRREESIHGRKTSQAGPHLSRTVLLLNSKRIHPMMIDTQPALLTLEETKKGDPAETLITAQKN